MLPSMGPSHGARVGFSVLLIASTGLMHLELPGDIPRVQAKTASEHNHGQVKWTR